MRTGLQLGALGQGIAVLAKALLPFGIAPRWDFGGPSIAQEKREQLADTFFSALSEIHEELNGIKDEALRLCQIDQAIECEREPWTLLNYAALQ